MSLTNKLAQQAILLLQHAIAHLGFKPAIHFELEGVFRFPENHNQQKLDFGIVNAELEKLGIEGEVVNEYWHNQWEYVSKFNGQSPFKEAQNLAFVLRKLASIFAKQGVSETLIQPVIWSGDKGKLVQGSSQIFTSEARAVHIPNAVQINISAMEKSGRNIVPINSFGEYLQQCFLLSSFDCALLYLPEADAYERLQLKSRYGLASELCSPTDISGGHQGSVALYKQWGKHNQELGIKPLVVDKDDKVLVKQLDWHKTARIEHRLGAASKYYNPYVNIVYALINLYQALVVYVAGDCTSQCNQLDYQRELPNSLFDTEGEKGAISIFNESNWFNSQLNQIQQLFTDEFPHQYNVSERLGDQLKQSILFDYQKNAYEYYR